MTSDQDFKTYDILRDKAPGLCARLHSDNKYANSNTGHEILREYDEMLFQGATEHDFSKARPDLRRLIALTNTLLAEGVLIDKLSTYEAERVLRKSPRLESPGENNKLLRVLDESRGFAQDINISMLEVESTCRSAIHHLYPQRVDSVNALLDELGEALARLEGNLQTTEKRIDALHKRTELCPADELARKHYNETLGFTHEVSQDALRITHEMQGLIAGLKEQRSADESRSSAEGPLPFSAFSKRLLAVAHASLQGRGGQPHRPGFDPAEVARQEEGTVAVSIHTARDTESYRNRMAARDTTGNDRGGR